MLIGLKELLRPINPSRWFFQKMFNERKTSEFYYMFAYEVDMPDFEAMAKEEDVDIIVDDTDSLCVLVTITEKTDVVGKAIYKKNR